jgi:hypothetical protein
MKKIDLKKLKKIDLKKLKEKKNSDKLFEDLFKDQSKAHDANLKALSELVVQPVGGGGALGSEGSGGGRPSMSNVFAAIKQKPPLNANQPAVSQKSNQPAVSQKSNKQNPLAAAMDQIRAFTKPETSPTSEKGSPTASEKEWNGEGGNYKKYTKKYVKKSKRVKQVKQKAKKSKRANKSKRSKK